MADLTVEQLKSNLEARVNQAYSNDHRITDQEIGGITSGFVWDVQEAKHDVTLVAIGENEMVAARQLLATYRARLQTIEQEQASHQQFARPPYVTVEGTITNAYSEAVEKEAAYGRILYGLTHIRNDWGGLPGDLKSPPHPDQPDGIISKPFGSG